MCFATTLRKSDKQITDRLHDELGVDFAIDLEFTPYYHLNGFTHGNLYIIKMDEPENIYPAAWGLVPDWGIHNPLEFWKKTNTLNARAESIFEKSTFKKSAHEKRCLILADGFFEPHHINKVSVPYFCYQPSKEFPEGDLFLFAGLYTELDDELYTATIITVEANDFFAEIHNVKKRMPLVLAYDLYQDWLDPNIPSQQINELMAFGFTHRDFKAHPVSSDIYKKGIDTNQPYILQPVEKNTLF